MPQDSNPRAAAHRQKLQLIVCISPKFRVAQFGHASAPKLNGRHVFVLLWHPVGAHAFVY
eukprot:2842165-Amphidinium_carterae.1